MIMLKPLLLLLGWIAGGALTVFALAMVFAPYLVSVIANIGRRPVVARSAKGNIAAVH
jgi:hypothetical protein